MQNPAALERTIVTFTLSIIVCRSRAEVKYILFYESMDVDITKSVTDELFNLFDEHMLTNTQHDVTRFNRNLDLHLTTRPSPAKSQNIIPGITDHNIVVMDSDIKPTYNRKPPRKVYSFNSTKADWITIKLQTVQYVEAYFKKNYESNSVDQNWKSIKNYLLDMMDKYIPSRHKSPRHNLLWLTTEVKRMIRCKQRKYYQTKKSCRPEDWKCYKEMKTSVRRLLRKAHADYNSSGGRKPQTTLGYIKSQRKDEKT